jgi:small subunit ribosomal protein S6
MAEARYYDLMVLLDPEAPEERRTELVEQIKRQIDSGDATLSGDADWGMRRLAFEIDHRREAQYHLFQFQAAADLLAQLDRTLSIEDAVLRHRIIRLPGEPPETTPRPAEEAPRRGDERVGVEEGEEAAPESIPDADASVEETYEDASTEAPEPIGEPVEAPPAPDEQA